MHKDYHINIFYSEEDQGYIADIPDLKYCSAYGETTRRGFKGSFDRQTSMVRSGKRKRKSNSTTSISANYLSSGCLIKSK